MPIYRAYEIGLGDRIVSVTILNECSDDNSAIETTRMLAHSRPMELWDKDRFVAKFNVGGNE
jgi:hypothetical protein